MPRRKTYLIESLLDECSTNSKTMNCDTIKSPEVINKECEAFRESKYDLGGCSGERERTGSMTPNWHGTLWRKAAPMPITRNQLENFPRNESSEYLLHRFMLPAQALSSCSIPSFSQLMSFRNQLLQMQQAAVQHLSSPSLLSTSSSQLLSSTSAKVDSEQLLSNQSTYRQHRFLTISNRRKSTVKKYRCDICEKTFSRSNTLVTHKRIHTGEKPFHCDHCGRAFRQPGNLTRHRLTHTTVKPYICSICQRAFNRASNLYTHMRTHSQICRTKIAATQSFGSV